ncbi:UGSC family (seleno)protein [Parapusillimonas sp. JC17]|uniref:UGSC family (seleno)protein n=1 Tax=Parapusillimonas sp. JC17 TaxID=3445768 RepID=UPI003FA08517
MLMKTKDGSVRVYDPRGIVRSVEMPTAARKASLDGLRLGVLDNSKWNANKLLRGAIDALKQEVGFKAVNYYVKHSFSKDAAPELIAQIIQENDIVLTAIGDCGSCTSGCLRDAIALESAGVPTAVIVTTEFVKETVLTREALGMLDLEPVIIAHPVSSITMEEVAQRVAQILTQAQAVWKGEQKGAAAKYLENRRSPD